MTDVNCLVQKGNDMKTPVFALLFALAVTSVPTLALSFDLNPVTPTLDFPEPSPEPVSQDKTDLDE